MRTIEQVRADIRAANQSLLAMFPEGNENGVPEAKRGEFDELNEKIRALDTEFDEVSRHVTAERDAKEAVEARNKRLAHLMSRAREQAKDRGDPAPAPLPVPELITQVSERDEEAADDSPLMRQFYEGGNDLVTPGRLTRSVDNKAMRRFFRTGDPGSLVRISEDWTRAEIVQARQEAQARANVATTPDASGGYLIPDDNRFMNRIVETMKAYIGVERLAMVFTTSGGNPMPIPTVDDTGNTAGAVAEGASPAETAMAFGEVVLGAFKRSTGPLPVSTEIMQDSGPALETVLGRLLGIRLGRQAASDYASGAGGAGAPNGILTATAKGGDLVWDRSDQALVNANRAGGVLARAVDIAYRTMANAAVAISDDLLNAFRTAVGAGTAGGQFLYPQLAFSDGPDAVRRFQGLRLVIEPNYPTFAAGTGHREDGDRRGPHRILHPQGPGDACHEEPVPLLHLGPDRVPGVDAVRLRPDGHRGRQARPRDEPGVTSAAARGGRGTNPARPFRRTNGYPPHPRRSRLRPAEHRGDRRSHRHPRSAGTARREGDGRGRRLGEAGYGRRRGAHPQGHRRPQLRGRPQLGGSGAPHAAHPQAREGGVMPERDDVQDRMIGPGRSRPDVINRGEPPRPKPPR